MQITNEQQLDIIKLCNGFFNAAPGDQFLKEFIAAIEGGATFEQLADAFESSSVFADTFFGGEINDASEIVNVLMNNYGLTPGNTDQSSPEWIAQNFFTAQLDGGASIAEIIILANNYLDGEIDPAFIAVQTLYNNKALLAQAYSAARTSTDVAVLQSIYDGLTGDAPLTQSQINDIIASAPGLPTEPFTLTGGIAAIEAAEDAVDAFLLEVAQDPDVPGEEAALTEMEIADALDDAVDAVALEIDAVGSYEAASPEVKASMISLEETIRAGDLASAEAALDNANTAIAAVPGLPEAIAAYNAAVDVREEADANEVTADASRDGAIATYNTLNGDTVVVSGDGSVTNSAETIPLIIVDGSGNLVLADGITNEDNPGIDALLSATIALETAEKEAAADALAAEAKAQAVVENLDAAAAGLQELKDLGAAFAATKTGITPVNVDAPTIAEIDTVTAILDDRVAAAETAAVDSGFTDLGEALTQLSDDILAHTADGPTDADSEAAFNLLTLAALTNGYITSADKAAIDTAYADTLVNEDGSDEIPAREAADAALDANNPLRRDIDFDDAISDYEAAVDAITPGDLDSPLANAQIDAQTDVDDIEAAIDLLAEKVATQQAAQDDADTLAALKDNITAAKDAFSDEGLELPISLDGPVTSATVGDDVFYIGSDSSPDIFDFGLLGSDALVIGTDFTLNTDLVAGDNGDVNALEVWITEDTGGALVTLETSPFGSEAAAPELIEVGLVGVDAADVVLADGVITVI